ncbi:MAG: TIGR03790 family protein [Bacteroidetes bacterium]|nr:TIGR03790 family protein [Bacteroidota bacterium]MCW5896106.1 TIGR03790 family protein [Bacteroidota bacterium]
MPTIRLLLAGLLICWMLPLSATGQVSYNDVAVIINTNSSASQTIGNYFKAARNIPAANMIYVQADTTEEIDSTKFNQLRAQVEQQLLAGNLQNSINYLVTTKGVPLKVNRGNTFSTSSPSSSVESELMLILGPYASYIGGDGRVASPYYLQNANFSRSTYGIYLVTRLDAYHLQTVLDLIDRSGPGVSVSASAPILFDQDPAWDSPLNTYMTNARNNLASTGRTVIFDSTTVYKTNQQNLVGYMSWGSNDHYQHLYTQYAIPYNTYVPGAIAETYVSTSGRTFNDPPTYGQSLVVDLLHEGVSGAKGYVYEPYSNAMALAFVLFPRYVAGYNLAESYYMASRMMSWMDVVVGDPKTSIVFSSSPVPVQLASFTGSAIPQNNSIVFNWRTISETNNYGFYLQRAASATSSYEDLPNSFVPGNGTTVTPHDYSWTYVNAPAGSGHYRLRQVDLDGTIHYTEPIVVVNGVTSVGEPVSAPNRFELGQNYPNPFNPSTEIAFSVDVTGDAQLVVYNSIGQQVATLYDGVAQAGQMHRVQLDASALASGTYFYRLQSGQKNELKKMVLLK